MAEYKNPETMSDTELAQEMNELSESITRIKCQYLENKARHNAGEPTRGKVWIAKSHQARLFKGQRHQVLLTEVTRRKKLNKAAAIAETAIKEEEHNQRFIDAARKILSREEYLAIWHMANSHTTISGDNRG